MRTLKSLTHRCRLVGPGLAFIAACFFAADRAAVAQTSADSPAQVYSFAAEHDPDGIGKFYKGREIAHVMGHEGADWLERPQRQEEERPDLLLAALKLQPGDVAADIGAGTGYFTWRMARIVGNTGKVYANDIQPEMLELLSRNMLEHHTTNFQTVLGTLTDAHLPARSLDLVLMVDVYHEFDHPYEMMQSICRALKTGGRVVWVEYRAEDPQVPIKPLHKMSEAQVRKEAAALPLRWVQTIESLPRQHIIIFQRVAQP
jgi:ubiquinone/menaquinone biosynthesis C-methylase UbiE